MLKIATLILLSPVLGWGQFTDSHREAARQLLVVMNLDKTLENMIDIIVTSFSENNSTFAENEDIIREFYSKHFSLEAIQDDFIDIYCNEFTEDELISITDFYKTDVGKKLISKLPELLRKGAEMGKNKALEFLPELLEKIRQRNKVESEEEKL